MSKKLILAAATAFALASIAAAPGALAQPSPSAMRKAGEVKDATKANEAVSKVEAKDAKKNAKRAHHYAKRAAHKAKVAESKSEKAEKSEGGH
jgi:hypothetical protein